MTRGVRIARNVAIAVAALIVVLVVAVLLVLRTGWFRNYVRRTIISSVEDSTGGRVDIGSFDFDERHLRAKVQNFVIHGTEPSNAAPFVSIPFIELDLRLFTSVTRLYELSYLGIDRPQVNVSMQADGRSNMPTPRQKSTSGNSTLYTVVNLAVGKFVLNNGDFNLFSVRQPLTIRGNNLHARLDYSLVKQAYDGELAIEPLYILNGRNTPVNFKVALPVTIAKDRIDLHHATITTPLSQISADGSVSNMSTSNMSNPTISAHLQGRIAGADLVNAGNIPMAAGSRKALPYVDLDANATADGNTIKVAALQVGFGKSNLEASGTLKDPRGHGSLQLRAELELRELGQIAGLSSRPAGTVSINAAARLDSANRYNAGGNIQARNLSFVQGNERISNVELLSAFHADPENLDLNGLRLKVFGGEFIGNASLTDFERYKLDGQLRAFGIQPALRAVGEKLPYDGYISGPVSAQGDIKAPGTKSIVANAHLVIAPGRRGIPVSGRLNANYNGAADDVVVENSWVSLPHTRLNLSGSLSRRLNVSLTSHDLHDLLAAVPSQGSSLVSLTNNGEADFSGAVTGALSKPRIAGHLAVTRFAIEGRQFDSLGADVTASSTAASVSNAALVRNAMQARANASIALRNWTPVPRSALEVNASLNNGDLADVMALAGQHDTAGYSGALSASAQITGTYGNPMGAAAIQAANGMIDGEPFNQIQFQVNLADQFVNLPVGYIDTPAGRVDFKAGFRHPRDSFSTGQVHAHVQSATLDLSRMTALEKSQGQSSGTVTIDLDVNGALQHEEPEFLLSAVNGDVSARGVRTRGVNYGDLTATAHTSGQNVAYNLTSNFAGSNTQATGTTRLVKDYPTTADLKTANLPIERALAAAGETSIPARGLLSASAHVSGTVKDPQGKAEIDISKAVLYDEKIDDARLRMTYLAQSIEVQQLEIVSGPSRIDATARYDHPSGSLDSGQARFTITSNHLDLARSATVQKFRAGLGGILDLNANGSANVQVSDPRVLLTAINANVSATGIAAGGKQFGDVKLTANTAGQRVTFALDSNLAGATLHGSGDADLNPQYPVDAQLSFHNVAWSRIADLTGNTAGGAPMFEATTDGDITVRGPLLDTKQLNGSLDVAKLNVTTIPRSAAEKPITIANQGPIQLSLNRGVLDIRNAHLTGPNTDIRATGSASVTGENLNLSLRANADIGVMQNFNRDIYSAGTITMATTVRGDLSKPLINGQLTLQKAAFNMAGFPLGISNANGTVIFNGNSAQISSLTAESGGGKINLSGSAQFSEALRFGLRADATNVRVRVQQGVSISADAGIRLTGTSDDSRVTGTATVNRVSYSSQSDIGSLLRRSAPPVQSPEAPSPLLSNMKLDIRVRSSPGLTVQSSISEDLQADVDLRIRGSADQPGAQGRVNISEGKLVFFGTTYVVDTGSIAFYNPLRVDPILDLTLEAQAQGVNVTLHVTGPIDNMKLSYTSDPPLQFQEIVSLLASGRAPTSDPTLLANQPSQPQQGFQQMGESAIVGQAVANPVANQLQRVFGVTQLKIDPTFTTGSDVPTARLALQQRITNNLTFTYVSAIDQPNSTVVRVEWAFSPQWSAVATRDQNGLFSVNFFYKRGFR